MPDFSLSPPIDPEVSDQLRILKYNLRMKAEAIYERGDLNSTVEGHPVINFFALEDPLIRKRVQRQEQRRRLKAVKLPHRRLQRSMGILRAKEWLEFYNYPFWHLNDGTMRRRWIDQSGKERMGGVVVGNKKEKAKRVKDFSVIRVGVTDFNLRDARQVRLFEDEMTHVPDELEQPFNMVTPEDVDHARRTRPMMPRPSNVGNGRGARPLPAGMKWKWDNNAGYIVTKTK